MKSFACCFLLLIAVSLFADDTAAAGTKAASISIPGKFQFAVPPGWQVQTLQKNQFPSAIEKKGDTVCAFISVNIDNAPGALDEWWKNSVARDTRLMAAYNVSFSDVSSFVTASGAKGFRTFVALTANGNKIHSVDYVFSGSNDAKIVVTCSCPAGDAVHYDPTFQEAIKTFVPY